MLLQGFEDHPWVEAEKRSHICSSFFLGRVCVHKCYTFTPRTGCTRTVYQSVDALHKNMCLQSCENSPCSISRPLTTHSCYCELDQLVWIGFEASSDSTEATPPLSRRLIRRKGRACMQQHGFRKLRPPGHSSSFGKFSVYVPKSETPVLSAARAGIQFAFTPSSL